MSAIPSSKKYTRIDNFTVLSLFDGMSCGQQAINRLGIKENYTYFSSEVDKYAMQVTRYNYPNTIFLGSVTDITIERYSETEVLINGKYLVDVRNLILIGGSPCQGFSFAGKQKGASAISEKSGEIIHIDITTLEQYLDLKEKEFEFNGQSYLFWEYIRIKNALQEVNPELIFLLENVKMTKKWSGMFDEAVGVESTQINSSLVSAQNRPRLYWSNKSDNIKQPKDKNILLHLILENKVDEKYYLSEKAIRYINREDRITKKLTAINGEKALCLMSQYDQSKNGTFLCVDSNGRIDEFKTGTVTQRYYKGSENYGSNPFILNVNTMRYRKLTPIECERLQTVDDNYTAKGLDENFKEVKVSDTQRYKMIGNGWTVYAIVHILKELNINHFFQNSINKQAA